MDESLSTPTESKLPIIVAGIAILLSAGSLFFAWKVNKNVNSVKQDELPALKTLVDEVKAANSQGTLNTIQNDLALIRKEQEAQVVRNGNYEDGLRDAGAAYVKLMQSLGARGGVRPAAVSGGATTPPAGSGGIAPATVVPAGAAGEYKIVAGDTFGKIAKKHGVSVLAIEAANPGVSSSKLKIGQKIVIPAKK